MRKSDKIVSSGHLSQITCVGQETVFLSCKRIWPDLDVGKQKYPKYIWIF